MDEGAVKKTREMFAMCDSDGDGVITKAELFKLVKDLGYEVNMLSPSFCPFPFLDSLSSSDFGPESVPSRAYTSNLTSE